MIKRVDPLAPVHNQTDQDKLTLVFTLLDKQTYTLFVPEPSDDPSEDSHPTRYCQDNIAKRLNSDYIVGQRFAV